MDNRTLGYLLHGWVLLTIATGMGLIAFGSTILPTVGAVLIIVGIISLMPAFRYYWWTDESTQ
ncbi:MAG: hypothetical protein V5A39_09100 [Haloarculaceae archaeon]